MVTTRVYLLSLATAAAVGAGTTQLADLSDAFAASLVRRAPVVLEVPATAPAAVDLKTRIKNATCPLIESEHGLPAEDCTVEDGSVTSIVWGDPVRVSHSAALHGTWTHGAPQ